MPEGEIVDGAAGAGSSGSAAGASGSGAAGSTSTGSHSSGTSQPAAKWEDDPRAKGMLADLQKERKARQDYETRHRELESNLAEERRRVAALTGIQPQSKEDVLDQQVRDRFKQLFPHLADLTPDDVQAIREGKLAAASSEAFQTQQWTNHHRGMLGAVHEAIAKDLGELNERQIKRINAAYVTQCEQDPAFMKQVEAGNKAAVLQFATEYLEDFVAPVTRKVTAQEAGRFRPVPGGRERSLPMKGDKPIDVNDPKAVEDFLVAGVKAKGGQFGRR